MNAIIPGGRICGGAVTAGAPAREGAIICGEGPPTPTKNINFSKKQSRNIYLTMISTYTHHEQVLVSQGGLILVELAFLSQQHDLIQVRE